MILLIALNGVLGIIVIYLAVRLRKASPKQRSAEFISGLKTVTSALDASEADSGPVLYLSRVLASSEALDETNVLGAMSRLVTQHVRLRDQLSESQRQISSQAQQMDSHVTEARTDALTRLANRRAFDDFLADAVDKYHEEGYGCCMMLADVDYFKKCNDTHGHHAGDEVLRQVAAILKEQSDSRVLVARYGGEEFAIVASGVSRSTMCQMAETLRALVASTIMRFDSKQLQVTISAGLAELRPDEDIAKFTQRVDDALYASKRNGRNCCHWHDGQKAERIKAHPASTLHLPRKLTEQDGVGALLGSQWMNSTLAQFDYLAQDPVAQVSSRPAFLDDLIRRVAQWRRERGQSSISLMLAQIDGYEKYSKTGAEVANLLVRTTSKVFKASMREMDHVTRMGEDTFAILMPGIDLEVAGKVAERVRKTILRTPLPRKIPKSSYSITLGVVELDTSDDMVSLLDRASSALTTAVHHGRNCTHKADVGRTTVRK